MNFLFFIIFFITGMVIGAKCLIGIILGACFEIPFTKKIYKMGIIKEKVVFRHIIIVFIYSIIVTFASFFVLKYSEASFVAYCMGMGVSLINLIGGIGQSKENILGYFDKYAKYINFDTVENIDIIDNKGKRVNIIKLH